RLHGRRLPDGVQRVESLPATCPVKAAPNDRARAGGRVLRSAAQDSDLAIYALPGLRMAMFRRAPARRRASDQSHTIHMNQRLVSLVSETLKRDPIVVSVRLAGSRARGDPTELSDWDYEVASSDFEQLRSPIEEVVAPFQPL